MKCEIIRDLLPSYIDGLTSQASNQEIEKHLENCEGCRGCLKAMKGEETGTAFPVYKEEIQPLKKLKKQTRGKIIGAALGAFFLCVVLVGGYLTAFEVGHQASSEDVELSYEVSSNGVITFMLSPREGRAIYFSGTNNDMTVHETLRPLIGAAPQKNTYTGVTITEDGRVLEPDGTSHVLSEEDVYVFRFKDKTIEYQIAEIAEEYDLT